MSTAVRDSANIELISVRIPIDMYPEITLATESVSNKTRIHNISVSRPVMNLKKPNR